jgi:nicotinamide riboside kinase
MAKVYAKKSTIKIVVTGPESSGKSTLSAWLANHFRATLVPEYARTYLEALDRKYNQHDLLLIAKQQIKNEDDALHKGGIIVCDTSLEVIRIWSEYKYNNCSTYIIDQANARIPDLFLLLSPDIKWEQDPLREHPGQREDLFALYQQELAAYGTEVVVVSGNQEDRRLKANSAIGELLSQD